MTVDFSSELKRKRRFAGVTPQFGTANTPKPEALRSRSPYYWWWQYLRRSNDYRQCCEAGGTGELAELFADFGDVRDGDFKAWWQSRGQYLFCEPAAPTRMRVVENRAELVDSDFVAALVLVLPLSMSKRYLRARFGELLKKEHPAKRGAVSIKWSKAPYPLLAKTPVRTLAKTLRVYDLRESEPTLSLYQIGEWLKLSPTLILSARDSPAQATDKKRMMGIIVSRYLRHAKAYIANVAKGQFPKK